MCKTEGVIAGAKAAVVASIATAIPTVSSPSIYIIATTQLNLKSSCIFNIVNRIYIVTI